MRLLRRLRQCPPRTLGSVEAYSHWAANYPPRAHNPLMAAEQAAMLELLPPLEDLTVLDLACGTGRYGLIARELGAGRVISVDNSRAMLHANPLSNRIEATSEAVPLPSRSVDVVVCALALGHLPRLEPSIREIGRVLAPGGWALISDIHPSVALAGGKRTFTGDDGVMYAVEHYIHTVEAYRHAAETVTLWLDTVRDVYAAGKVEPVAVVYVMRKTEDGGVVRRIVDSINWNSYQHKAFRLDVRTALLRLNSFDEATRGNGFYDVTQAIEYSMEQRNTLVFDLVDVLFQLMKEPDFKHKAFASELLVICGQFTESNAETLALMNHQTELRRKICEHLSEYLGKGHIDLNSDARDDLAYLQSVCSAE
jgi:malonyl-CoA O-methyltransferase